MSENHETARRRTPPRPDRRSWRPDGLHRPSVESSPASSLRRVASAKPEADGIDIRALLGVVRRRLPVIVGTVVLATAVAAVYVSQLVPRYSAEAGVMLDTRHVRLGFEDMMSGLEVDGAVVRSEIDLIRSYPLAAKVAKQLHLERDPEFNPRLRRPTFADHMRHPVGFALSELRRLLPGASPDVAAVTWNNNDDRGIAWSLMGHIGVSTDGRSYLLRIRAQSESPEMAAKIANAYAETYLLDQLELKYDAVRRTSAWLNEHLSQLRDKVRDSENAVQLFRQQHDITETRAGSVTAQQLTEINTQLIAAAADRAQKEASFREAREQTRAGGAAPNAAVLNSPLLQKLREQQAELMQRQAQLETRYKPAHPVMVNLRAELQDVARKIEEETNKASAGLAADVAVARAREAALRDVLAGLQRSTDQQDMASIQLRALQREAAANKVLYENFLSKFKQTSAQEDLQQPDARLVAPAMPPTGPSYPNRPMLMSMVVVVSAFGGIILAFLLERLDNGFRAGEQIEQEFGVRALGLVPDVSGKVPQKLVVDQPKALYSEAVRSVRTALRHTNIGQPPKLVLVTSSLPAEGKTVLALSLARSVARSGGRALLVDCDLRRPAIAKLTGCGTGRNLLDLFDGAEPETLISRDGESGIDVITAKAGTANPQDLLGSPRMQAFLEAMRARYDLIVLDAPPVLVVSDPIVLSHLVDATLFLVRWEKSARRSVKQGLQRMEVDGAGVTGAVITRVNPRRHARYGYGDSAYYYYYDERPEAEAPARA